MKKELKLKRQRKALARKICKEIFNKSGLKPQIKVVGSGYFIIPFGGTDINLHFSFKEIPGVRFGIWTNNKRVTHIFAEHENYIDKFKWTQTAFHWEDDMDAFVNKISIWASDYIKYYTDMYNTHYEFVDEINKDFEINGFSTAEYKELNNKFKAYMESLIDKGYINGYMYKKSEFFCELYDVIMWCDPKKPLDDDCIDDIFDDIYRKLRELNCEHISPKSDFILKKPKYSPMRKWYAVGDITKRLWVRRAPNIITK